MDNAVLEYYCGVSKDEIGRAKDVGFGVELALGVDAEGVLVSFEAAPVEDRAVRPRYEGNGLAALRARRVAEGDAPGHESVPGHRWKLIRELASE